MKETSLKKLQAAKENLQMAIQMLEEVEQGKLTKSNMARIIGVTSQELNNYMNGGWFPYIRRQLATIDKLEMFEIFQENQTPAEKLLSDVLGIHDKILVLTEEEENRFLAQVKSLKEREQKILCAYYGIGQEAETLDTIGKQYNVTRERVRQIIAKSVRLLRHPARLKAVALPVDYLQTMEKLEIYEKERSKYLRAKEQLQQLTEMMQQTEQVNDSISTSLKALSLKALGEWKQALGIKTWNDLHNISKEELAFAAKKNGLSLRKLEEVCDDYDHPLEELEKLFIPIEGLDLSVRSYNCLKRAGLLTVADIILAEDKLLKVRNLGRKSILEINEAIAAL